MKNKMKRKIAMMMAMIMGVTAMMPGGSLVMAQDNLSEEPALYDASVRTDLDEDEIATAEDISISSDVDSNFDIVTSTDGITFKEDKVSVTYYSNKGSFDINKAGDYDTYYEIKPVSGKTSYLIHRTISVKEPAETPTVSKDAEDGGDDAEETDPDKVIGEAADFEDYPLAEGEIDSVSETNLAASMSIKMVSASMLTAKASSSMKVSYSGYAKYCGHSMGIKYISSDGDYKNHLVFCMDMNKNSTNGTVTASSTHVKPEITFCMVNGARTLNGKCHTDKYSAGSAAADYFITSAAIHVLNGEVKLSYYNNGSTVYSKISSLVSDAKKYDKDQYDTATGKTISITYKISPKTTKWKKMEDDLYRTTDKFVRTKSGTITDVKYSISGYPAGLTVGELKTDSSDIDDASDLKKYDLCVAQTDASKASSNFYLYCNAATMAKINAAGSVIKVKANAYADEKFGRKWTPTVVSQQKITFLEEESTPIAATVKVTAADYNLGSLSIKKVNEYTKLPVAGATYYLYEDSGCTDLLAKLSVTGDDGLAATDIEMLTQSKYYLKEVHEADGYEIDSKVYEIPLSYFKLVDASGKVTQAGKSYDLDETPLPVGVTIRKTDAESGNIVVGAGFAVFNDVACTVRTTIDGNAGTAEVPVFYYDADLDRATSSKFTKKQDTYYVKEVVVPDGYRDDGTVWPVKPDYGEYAPLTATNTPIRCDVNATKKSKEAGALPGDAVLEGATYGLYAAEAINYPDGRGIVTYTTDDAISNSVGKEFTMYQVPANKDALLATVQTDADGNFNFGHLYYGNYYIKEIEPSEGYLLDPTAYPVNFREAANTHQDISYHSDVIETPIKQPFEIIKVSTDGADTETDYVKDAEFTVKLQSEIDKVGWDAATTYDVLTTDEKGNAVSKELPYGTYLVKETKVPVDLYKTDDFTVVINEDSREPQAWRILNDAPFKAHLRIVKKDAETGKTVLLPNVQFKIKNCQTEEYVEQKVGSSKVNIFTTDETGEVTTPLKLKYGEYEVEEITAPEGYVISEESYPITITKSGAVKVEEDEDGDAVIEVEISNPAVKGSISLRKSGEVLTNVEYDTIVDRILSAISGEDRTVDFVYEEQNLKGAVYNLVADEDIYTPDHQVDEEGNRILEVINGVPATKGAIVATLTTDENGEAEITDLPLGKYHLEEVTAPNGFVLCEESKNIELTYEDQNTEVVYGNAEFVNERVKTNLKVLKKDLVTNVPVAGAVYSLYATEDIVNVLGETVVTSGSLVDVAETNENGEAIFEADLPLGKYMVKETESPAGYVLDSTEYPVDFTYQDQKTAVLTKEIAVEETPIIVEVSKTDITSGKDLIGAKLEIINSDGEVYAEWTTDGKAHQLEAIPAGEYTLRETFAPYGYLIANEVDFTVEETGEIQKVAMSDERVKGKIVIYKTDADTKKPIKGVEFEVRDADGKVIATLVTDKKGYAETDVLDIGTYGEDGSFAEDIHYFVVETKAADGYKMDDKVHDIVLQYDDDAPEVVVYQLDVKNKSKKPSLPQTGGDFNPWMYVAIGGAFIAGGIFYYRRKRKKNV